jgi:glycosyltransferase involved in cell wall biosynthesis
LTDKVAILTNIPTPYTLPIIRELVRYCDLLVVFDDHSEPNREWSLSEQDLEFRHTFAKGVSLRYRRTHPVTGARDERYLQIRYGVLPALHAFKPRLVASAQLGVRTALAAAYCKATGTPLVVGWEGTRHSEKHVSAGRVLFRRLLLKTADRIVSNGRESAALLLQYGVSPDSIDEITMGVDTRFYASEANNLTTHRARIRSELGVAEVVLLFVGQLIERKGLRQYLEALGKLYDTGLRGWSAVFVGSGPMEGALRDWRSKHPDVPVNISGFVPPQALPRFFAAADVFVMPSLEDVWGMVGLEAAVSGLPQIFSVYSGATYDLLHDERVGRIVDPLKVSQLTLALQYYIENPPPRLPDKLVRDFVDHYSPERVAARWWSCFQKALKQQ